MEIKELNNMPGIEQNSKLNKKLVQFKKLINELKKKEIPHEITAAINANIDGFNSVSNSEKEFGKQLKKAQRNILKLMEKELKIVTKNHYRNSWIALGLGLGVAFGTAIGTSTGNVSLLGLGLPLGLVIGMAIGTSMDKKAKDTGKQLDLEIKY